MRLEIESLKHKKYSRERERKIYKIYLSANQKAAFERKQTMLLVSLVEKNLRIFRSFKFLNISFNKLVKRLAVFVCVCV